MAKDQITICVPATTANLGPGYDCLGMALDLWNEIKVEISTTTKFSIVGEGSGVLSKGKDNLVYRSMQKLFREINEKPIAVNVGCNNNIPLARGLGSSAAAIVGGLMAANKICSNPLSQDDLLSLAFQIEGHGDNVAPALLGGLQAVVKDGKKIISETISIPAEITAVIFIPEKPMVTEEGRAILSKKISRDAAVYNLGRVAILVNSLSSGSLDNLKIATQDKLHQPDRAKIFPAMKYIIRSAENAGALCAFLSGAGSSIVALTDSRSMTIGYEMADVADKIGVPGVIKVTKLSAMGAHVYGEI